MVAGARRPLGPNHVVNALAAFRRAIRAHRRLMKLAPDRFDYGIVRQNALMREKEEKRLAELEKDISKVYGVTEFTPEAARALRPDFSKKRNPRTERVIAREVETWQAWLDAGSESLALARKENQWSRMSVASVCGLLETASTLGRLSTGLETNYKPVEPEPGHHWDFEAALEKIYGKG